MDPRLAPMMLQFSHPHDDGSMGTFEREPPPHHDPAEHDPERLWGSGTLYRCTSCDEQILVDYRDELDPTRD